MPRSSAPSSSPQHFVCSAAGRGGRRRRFALELCRLPEALDDVELAAVREATPRDLAGRAHEVAGVAEPRVVDEENPALRLQRAADALPERLEVPGRHVRVPEPEEADVE